MIIFLIFLSFWLGLSLSIFYIVLGIISLFFLIFIFKRFSKRLGIICLASLALGFGVSFINVSYQKTSFQGVVYNAEENYFLINSGGERLYVYQKGHSYDIGDILTIEGEKKPLSFVTLESSFDFQSYLNKKGVFSELEIKNTKVNFSNFIRLRNRREKLLDQFNEKERSIIGAILFSDGIDSELSSDLKELHLAKFLSTSGLFITAFYSFLKFIMSFFLKDKYTEIVSLALLTLYGVFTFPKFSVIKILFLLTLRFINKNVLKDKFSYLTIIGGLGLFFLILNRYLALQDGFILGFLIPIISYLTRYIKESHKIIKKLYRYLIIYLFFIPFEIIYYNKVVILSLPLQLLLTPIFLVIGIVSLLCFFYVPIYSLDKFLIFILEKIVLLIKPLSFGIYFPSLNEFIILIYYALYSLFLYYSSIYFVPFSRLFLFSQIVTLMILALPIENAISQEVNFINVGQGDCTLIRDKQKVALIDTGGLTYKDVANEILIPYLRKKRIYKIDTVIITHYDFDHFGALEELSKSYQISHLYDYYSSFPIKMGDITFNNFNYYGESKKDENDHSLVISFNFINYDFLIMGDATTYVEKQIIKNVKEIPCDILKVGHHGSNTSTSEEWLRFIKPQEAVISVGLNNSFGHPNKEVINNLNKYHIKIRRTDIEGTIIYRHTFV